MTLGLLALASVFARDTLTDVAVVAAVLVAVLGRARPPSGRHPDGEQQLG